MSTCEAASDPDVNYQENEGNKKLNDVKKAYTQFAKETSAHGFRLIMM